MPAKDPLGDLLFPAPARPARRESIKPCPPPSAPIAPAGTHAATAPQGRAHHGHQVGPRYLVRREGTVVCIREFDPTGHTLTAGRDKPAAWDLALRLAAPAKAAQDPQRRLPASIVFINQTGERRLVQAADAH